MKRARILPALLVVFALAACGDGGVPSPAADLAVPVDLSVARDFAAPPDLARPPDLTLVPDLTQPRCDDGVKNGDESDSDCGGATCPRCGVGRMCKAGSDCGTAVCSMGVCVLDSCTDMVKNGNETDIDCGGSCPKCPSGRACKAGPDCASGVCTGNTCAAPSCSDMVKNGDETDVDCGGMTCGKCGAGRQCGSAADCASGVCAGGLCTTAGCTDNVKNGNETDIDCGGACPPCGAGKACGGANDCQSAVCANNLCAAPSCTDMVKNGNETDIDCGGACGKCVAGQACLASADCQSGVCAQGKCAAPSCTDMVKNGNETDVDCGGACGKCVVNQACNVDNDCVANAACANNKCACKSGYYGNTCLAARTCNELHQLQPQLGDGVHMLDWGTGPKSVYCDMTTDGGGWTLVAYVPRGSASALCTDTGIRNFYSLATGGGTYDGAMRKTAASLAAAPIAMLSKEILFARDNADFYIGNIAGMTVANKFTIPSPAMVNFANSNPDVSNNTLRGACVPVTLTTIKGPNATGQTRYTFTRALSTTWSDTYPTSYGAMDIATCIGPGSGRGPSFASDYSGVGHPKNYCWPFDGNGGAYTYWHLGWWDADTTGKTGSATIWLK